MSDARYGRRKRWPGEARHRSHYWPLHCEEPHGRLLSSGRLWSEVTGKLDALLSRNLQDGVFALSQPVHDLLSISGPWHSSGQHGRMDSTSKSRTCRIFNSQPGFKIILSDCCSFHLHVYAEYRQYALPHRPLLPLDPRQRPIRRFLRPNVRRPRQPATPATAKQQPQRRIPIPTLSRALYVSWCHSRMGGRCLLIQSIPSSLR